MNRTPSSRSNPDPPTKLLARAARGDAQAFGDLYEKYLSPIYRYIYYRVSDQHAAEDLTETVFMKVWEGLPSLKLEGLNFRAWVYRIAHNTVIDYYRTRKQEVPLEWVDLMQDGELTPERQAEKRERSQSLARAIRQLPDRLQQVITCRFISGLSHAETAEIMGLSQGHVRVLQHRALMQLRSWIQREAGSHE